jgi:hypothetical protein
LRRFARSNRERSFTDVVRLKPEAREEHDREELQRVIDTVVEELLAPPAA